MIVGVYPYIRLNGNTKEAVAFYEAVFDAEVLSIHTYGDFSENPDFQIADEIKQLVSHAQLKIGDTLLMLSDTFPGEQHEVGTQLNVAILIADINKTNEVFEKLQTDGEVLHPLEETPFSPAYGQVKDKYQITWQISTVEQ